MVKFFSFVFFVFITNSAFAHDPDTGQPNWITKGEYRGKDGVHCCGPNDCEKVDRTRIKFTPNGIVLLDFNNEVVPYTEAAPSEDQFFWRCHKYNELKERRCFFAPVGGY